MTISSDYSGVYSFQFSEDSTSAASPADVAQLSKQRYKAPSSEDGTPNAFKITNVVPVNAPSADTTSQMPESALLLWPQFLSNNLTMKLVNSIVHLLSAKGGAGEGRKKPLSHESLNAFLEFWDGVKDVAIDPDLSLAPDGTLVAEWYNSVNRRLDVRFLGKDVVFGLIAGARILEGVDSQKSVILMMRNHPASPLKWGPHGA